MHMQMCREDVLKLVDNLGLLCLATVWCYLCLQNIRNLPRAEERLLKAEECFAKCYGPNLERVAKIKVGFFSFLPEFLTVSFGLLSSFIAKLQIQNFVFNFF